MPGDVRRRTTFVLLGLVLLVLLAGCASGPRGPTGPVVSPTGIVYEPGVPPRDTRYSQTATLYLRQDRHERALEFALEGIEEEPGNPVHYFLAGSAYARLERYGEADRMFAEAERIYPAYELDVEPERESAWAVAFNEGVEAYGEGEVDRAVEAWRAATRIFSLRPEAHRNLATLLAGEGRYEEAIDVYRDALTGLEDRPATRVLDESELREREELRATLEESLVQLLLYEGHWAEAEPLLRKQLRADPEDVTVRSQLGRALDALGRVEEASRIYTSLLSEETLASTQLFNLGVALFRAGSHRDAARAFRRLTDAQPESRDAWFNYANALFAAEAWQELAPAGRRLVELDPLGENAALIAARALLEIGDEEAAVRGVEQSDAAPVHVEQLQMRPDGGGVAVHAQIVGNAAEEGSAVPLRFVFYGEDGILGRESVTIRAPPPDATTALEVPFDQRASWYRYELVSSPDEPETPSGSSTATAGEPSSQDDRNQNR